VQRKLSRSSTTLSSRRAGRYGVHSTGSFRVHVAFAAYTVVIMFGWDFETKVLLGLPVLVTVKLLDADYLFESIVMELSINFISRDFSR
jgi:hypothetical protein